MNYMGCIFERMCMQHIEWLSSQDQLPFDILAVNPSGRKALLGECKYHNGVLDLDVIYTLQQRAALSAICGRIFYVLPKNRFLRICIFLCSNT